MDEWTEGNWLNCTSPRLMLQFLESCGDEIKLELARFAAGCCRRIQHIFPEERRQYLETVDKWGEGSATAEALEEAVRNVLSGWDPSREQDVIVRENAAESLLWLLRFDEDPIHATRSVCVCCQEAERARVGSYAEEKVAQASLLREVIGNPFQSS